MSTETHHSHMQIMTIVFVSLLCLTAITVFASYQDFGSAAINIIVAVTIATVKAGLVAVYFMHLKWERLSLIYTILLPPIAILVFIALMNIEANYVYLSRLLHFVNLG